jgi:general stress protein 26
VEPKAEQDIRFGDPGVEPTPWADVTQVLETAELYWISTVRRDGRPHVTPLPAVWADDHLYFCTGPSEQKAVNLRANPRVALTTGSNQWKEGLDVVVEGVATPVHDEVVLQRLADMWRAKYHGDWDFTVHDNAFHHAGGGSADVFAVAPDKILAFAKGRFAQTRFRFESSR